MSLDIDVKRGFGPETVRFNFVPGYDYLYAVHLFAGEGTLFSSNAEVTFSDGFKVAVPKLADVDAKYEKARWWIVAFIDGTTGEGIIINQFQGDPQPSKYLKAKMNFQNVVFVAANVAGKMDDDVQALVIDNGSGLCKAGFCGMIVA
jgi:hypothetical protein